MDGSLDGPSTELLGILASIILGAAFAAVEEALGAFGEPRARAAREGTGPNARTAARFLDHTAAIQIRLLTGRVVSVMAASVIAYQWAMHQERLLTRALAMAIVALFYAATVGIAITLARRRASRLALPLLRYSRPLEVLIQPLAGPLIWASMLIDKLYPPRPEDDPVRVTEVEVEHLIEQGEEHGSIDEDHAELLKSVLEFQDTVAREIMVPRTSMVAIDIDTPVSEVVELIVRTGHSRYPVYRGGIDRLEGILYAKDLFRTLERDKTSEVRLARLIRRPVFFSSESQKISGLLRQMQARRIHLAIVVDEFGGTSGMVTLEDIIEEIVGEIDDEHDTGEPAVRQIAPGRYLASADVSIHDVAEITGLQLPQEVGSYDSLGGLVVELAGRVPVNGDSIEVGHYDLIVRNADERHVTEVEVVERDFSPAAE